MNSKHYLIQIYSWEQIFKVQPIISDLEYLVDQHLYCALIIEGDENEYLGKFRYSFYLNILV